MVRSLSQAAYLTNWRPGLCRDPSRITVLRTHVKDRPRTIVGDLYLHLEESAFKRYFNGLDRSVRDESVGHRELSHPESPRLLDQPSRHRGGIWLADDHLNKVTGPGLFHCGGDRGHVEGTDLAEGLV